VRKPFDQLGSFRAHLVTATVLAATLLGGCSSGTDETRPGPSPSPGPQSTSSRAAPASQSSSPAPATPSAATTTSIVEPTTTNTLPPPPAPSKPAPTTAGDLDANSLPVPAGWKTVVREGGAEEGYLGNGSWVHARDARYAAEAVITIGCAAVTRDDYPDPVDALEGTYQNGNGDPGIGLVLRFAKAQQAESFFSRYQQQVEACAAPDSPVQARIVASALGLIDQRSYDDLGEWTEMARVHGSRITLVMLTDPGHRIGRAEAERVLRQIGD
jgi:hypothetical protein